LAAWDLGLVQVLSRSIWNWAVAARNSSARAESSSEEARLEEEPRDKIADVVDVDVDRKDAIEEGNKATPHGLDQFLKETWPA